jgi:hypothetical protein
MAAVNSEPDLRGPFEIADFIECGAKGQREVSQQDSTPLPQGLAPTMCNRLEVGRRRVKKWRVWGGGESVVRGLLYRVQPNGPMTQSRKLESHGMMAIWMKSEEHVCDCRLHRDRWG